MVPKSKSHQIILKMCTLVSSRVLNSNLTGFSFPQNLRLILDNFGPIN